MGFSVPERSRKGKGNLEFRLYQPSGKAADSAAPGTPREDDTRNVGVVAENAHVAPSVGRESLFDSGGLGGVGLEGEKTVGLEEAGCAVDNRGVEPEPAAIARIDERDLGFELGHDSDHRFDAASRDGKGRIR